jgi:hypothetical protein
MNAGNPVHAGGGDCRCLCGSLVARLVDDGVELKCRRCKRTLLVSLEPTPAVLTGHRPLRPRVVREVG